MFASRVEGEKYTASIHAGFSAHEERERVKRQQAQCMNTPKRMLDYLKSSPMAQEAFDDQGEERVLQNIDYLFQRCSEITKFKPDALLDKLDFKPNSRKDEEWLAALVSVMKTIVLLRDQFDFEEIAPLKKPNSQPEADLKATRRGVTYAIEVYKPKEDKTVDCNFQLAEIVADKYDYDGKEYKEGKKKQTRATMVNHSSSRELFVINFESCSIPKKELQNAAKYALAKMIGFPETHILIFTGTKWYEPSKEDECWAIEPALPD
ncbi:MAG: hypothetical protein HOP32_02930 [Nitrospira sp.]|nr:hypothetical protein [Nitrospira sp.]